MSSIPPTKAILFGLTPSFSASLPLYPAPSLMLHQDPRGAQILFDNPKIAARFACLIPLWFQWLMTPIIHKLH